MKKKSESVSDIIFGIVFVVMGGLLLYMRSEMLFVKIVAIADLVLGAVMLISGILGTKSKDADEPLEPAAPQPAEESYDWSKPAKEEPKKKTAPAAAAAAPVAAVAGMSAAALAAKEAELRKIAKQRRAEARQAAAEADEASARAAAAEQELVNAEQEVKQLHGVDQQAALARVDKLADRAMDLSQQAAFAARKAKVAERAYKEAAAEHSAAMDAAAEAMLAEEDAGWSK